MQYEFTFKFSVTEYRRDVYEPHISIPGAYIIVAACPGDWIRSCVHDVVKDRALLGTRILLQRMLGGTQLRAGSVGLLDHS